MTITITITFTITIAITITIGEMGPGNHHLTIVAKCHTDLTDIFCNRVILKWKTGDSYLFVCVVGDPVGALRRDCYTLKIFECTYVHQFKHHHHGQLVILIISASSSYSLLSQLLASSLIQAPAILRSCS